MCGIKRVKGRTPGSGVFVCNALQDSLEKDEKEEGEEVEASLSTLR